MTYAIVPINPLPLVRPVEEQIAERDAMTARMNSRKDRHKRHKARLFEIARMYRDSSLEWIGETECAKAELEKMTAERDHWKGLSESQTEAMGRMDRGTL